MPVSHNEKCICQICICGQHRCEASKSRQIIENLSKSEEKIWTQSEVIAEEKVTEEETSYEKRERSTPERERSLERSRKQWETSPDQMKEISRSLSELNTSHIEKKDHKTRTKRSKSKENLIEYQTNRSTLPPINTLSDSDSGKELPDTCICEGMYKSNGVLDSCTESNQWIVSRPIRNKPKDNLRLEGLMEMETTFKNSYDSTAKQINENISKNVAIVMPSNKLSSDESDFQRLKASKINGFNPIKASKKKPKYRPSTSLKAGGDGYFSTINKESYKNFVIIDDKSKAEKSKSSFNGNNRNNGKNTSVCCSTVSNIKLPKVYTSNEEDNHQNTRRKSGDHLDHQSSQIEQVNRSMQRMTTSDILMPKHASEKIQTNGNFCSYVDTSVQTNFHQINDNQNDNYSKNREQKSNEKNPLIAQNKEETEHIMTSDLHEANTSWTVNALEEHKRIYTRDVDSIKELGLLDKSDQQIVEQIQRETNEEDKPNKAYNGLRTESIERSRDKTRVRYESKNYVQQQRRQKKHKNESSIKLFDGDMDFTTTTRTYFVDKSPNRFDPRMERERTAGKKSRKSGRKRNLFRTSTEAEFYEPYGEKTTQTTYQRQFGDKLYCPAIDLGSNKSDFKYRGEASGHKFFLPAVDN